MPKSKGASILLSFRNAALSLVLVACSIPATAKTYTANSSNFGSIFYSAKSGDRIVLSGDFGHLKLRNRSFSTGLNIDASKARFTDSLLIKNVSGLNFTGGTFGSTSGSTRYGQAISIHGGSDINFTGSAFVGNGNGAGLTFSKTDNVNVTRSSFTSLRRGLSFTGVTNGTMTHNKFVNSSSDGAAIADSHFVTASNNSCSGTAPSTGAHPDCIQLWSVAGNAVQSDITLSDNTAIGKTQGFTSFNPASGGGLRISMLRNRVNLSYPQGIACYNCVDSLFADNVLTTIAGSQFQTRMNIVGGRNNIMRNNSIGGFTRPVTAFSSILDTTAFTTAVDGSAFDPSPEEFVFDDMGLDDWALNDWTDDDASYVPLSDQALAAFAIGAGVPEPGTWLQLLAGMLAIGWAARRRRVTVTA